MTPARPRYQRAAALDVARELCAALRPACDRLIVAGSLRRRRPTVGDVEILYISRSGTRRSPGDWFGSETIVYADDAIAVLESSGVLARRKNVLGRDAFGPQNKLMVHLGTGIPVDLFSCTSSSWYSYLVCRTGACGVQYPHRQGRARARLAMEPLRRGVH